MLKFVALLKPIRTLVFDGKIEILSEDWDILSTIVQTKVSSYVGKVS